MFSSPRRKKSLSSSAVKPTERERDGVRRKGRSEEEEEARRRSTKPRSKTSSSSSSKGKDRDSVRRSKSYRTVSSSSSSSKMAAIVPEMQRRASVASAETKSPSSYPTFSKAHSKESVNSREEDSGERRAPYTPNTTDLGRGFEGKARNATAPRAPPSPPLTSLSSDIRRVASANSMRRPKGVRMATPEKRNSVDGARPSGLRASHSSSSFRAGSGDRGSPHRASTMRESRTRTAPRQKNRWAQDGTTSDSDATSVAPSRDRSAKPKTYVDEAESSPGSVEDSSPRTPPANETLPKSRKDTPEVEVVSDEEDSISPITQPATRTSTPSTSTQMPPPPPPPPPLVPQDRPRVDYLLQNGGLPHVVPRSLLSGVLPMATLVGQQQNGGSLRASVTSPSVQSIFAPLSITLDAYNQVMSKNGSIAVATGYRSVARRLLDRLEAVFSRNISSESCPCVMCANRSTAQSPVSPGSSASPADDTGVSWGEILEYVSGRRELPAWPPFILNPSTTPADVLGAAAPMQKLDIDVPDEYREHYIRQSKKTKQAVQSWLAAQPEMDASPPQEADDETLTFAILTHLEPQNRPMFHALLRGLNTIPLSRAPTPASGTPKAELITKTSSALHRLYGLGRVPRDAECTLYLLKNPHMHSVLATIAAVSPHEWEILTSGRFDGFLWSGAESSYPAFNTASPAARRGATPMSRTGTPYTPPDGVQSRGPTPSHLRGRNSPAPGATPSQSSFGAPVQLDEDTEIAALAEVEREIYASMEALEDAFEVLHNKAETVRKALRDRSAGLASAAQARRGSGANGIEVRMDTPASAASGWSSASGFDAWSQGDARPAESVLDFQSFDDGRSELAPDDSASNVGYRDRERRRKEGRASRKERRTPAPVEEERDEDGSDAGRRRRR